MGALKDDDEDIIETDELEFDVQDDWRKTADSGKVDLFKEDDMECGDDELDISSLSLDLNGESAKEAKKEHARATAARLKAARTGNKKDADETLKALQNAVDGDGSGQDEELEILSEEDSALVNDPIFTNKGNEYPQIHGNYFLLDHLVDGGMAKVCRARYLGEGDEADKMVAIKMVQEKFSSDEDFVQMFIDEIKVSFGLNHPNINTTFDYGKIGKNLFVSMEYIHGKDLMVVVNELKKKGKTIPVPMCIFIASKMCEALHYAHNFTNKLTGQKYNIVHRDISPHNAMISYEGYVKVIDFGIAKADTNSTKEEEGTIKGKINYFAPEYLEGKKINHTYDQFAVALTLWEMLTGKKTFEAPDQLLTLKKILECNPELPSKYNKKVPKELDRIIMKALSRDPSNRHKDMQFFNKELMKTLYKHYPDFHESDLAEMMTKLFKESYQGDLEKFKEFGKYSIGDIVSKIKAYKDFQKRQKEKAQAKSGKAKEVVFDFGFEEDSVSARGKGKKGIDNLMGSRKKKGNPTQQLETERKKRQKQFASLLEDQDVVYKSNSPFDDHKGKIIFLSLIALGFFQKEVIMEYLFSNSKMAKQVQYQQEVNEQVREQLSEKRKKDKENLKFLRNLKDKNEEEVTPEPAKVAAPVRQRVRPAKAEVAPVNMDQVKELLDKQATNPSPSNEVANPTKRQREETRQRVAPGKAEVQVEDIANFSVEDLKKRMEEQLRKKRNEAQQRIAAPVQEPTAPQEVAPVAQEEPQIRPSIPEQNVKAVTVDVPEKEIVEDVQNLSIEELRERMKKNLLDQKKILDKVKEQTADAPSEGMPNLEEVKVSDQPESVDKDTAIAGTENVEEAQVVAPSNDNNEETNPKVGSGPRETRELSSTEKELAALKAKMDALLKEQEEEPQLEKKPSITLSPEDKQALGKEEKDVQRDLATKSEKSEDASSAQAPSQDPGAVDKVLKFIKTRKAFSWIFDN